MCDRLGYYVAQDLEMNRKTTFIFDPHKINVNDVGLMILGIGLSPLFLGGVFKTSWEEYGPDQDNFLGSWDVFLALDSR